jgi:CHASE2 domain/CHAT domain
MADFDLTIRKFQQICAFELSWGSGQRLEATSNYPESLSSAYQEWQHVYLSYYQSGLRSWIEAIGNLTPPPIDWHGRLVQAQAKLLAEFHHWLRGGELFEIRTTIANGGTREDNSLERQTVSVLLTCNSMELERLPWETWEIGAELPTSRTFRWARGPSNIHYSTERRVLPPSLRRRKARVLVILGDETGLNFQGDRSAIQGLARSAEVAFVGWQPGQNPGALKTQIRDAIADERGWDVLLFAGHSNETAMTGGELAIAPQTSLSLSEIKPQLLEAKERGLQFALFNSCKGLSLAHSLIDLGLSQVAVMREPIHNDVAQVFLLVFLQALAEHKDVHDCLLAASAVLKQSKNLTYPSAYLIPSLFCHPGAQLFQIPQKPGLWQRIKLILPTASQAIALSTLSVLSLLLPVQDWLLERRVLTQAIYRQITQQIPTSQFPPVLLVQIDEKSIQKAKISKPKPMERKYLASLVDRLVASKAEVIGLDYLLYLPHGESDTVLARSLTTAIQKRDRPPFFVFAADFDDTGEWRTVLPEIAHPNWSLQGHIYLLNWHMYLLPHQISQAQKLPFSYLLALAYSLKQSNSSPTSADLFHIPTPSPNLNNKTDLFSDITDYYAREQGRDYKTLFSPASQTRAITTFSYDLKQMWLHPILDFSLPPSQIYQAIPAWKLRETAPNSPQFAHLDRQVAIVVPRYSEAGIDFEGQDRFPLHAAIDYWLKQDKNYHRRTSVTGGEVHAYLVHHYLNQRFVIPIPDLWLMGLFVLLGKGIEIVVEQRHLSLKQRRIVASVLFGFLGIYGAVSLQLYISAAVLFPWVLPAITLGIYILPLFVKKTKALRF